MKTKLWSGSVPALLSLSAFMGLMLVAERSSSARDVAGRDLPDDLDFALQWSLHNTGQTVNGSVGIEDADLDAPEAWETCEAPSPVLVAIVGTGVDPHAEFADRLLPGHSVVGDPFDTLDECGPGTLVAGIIGAARNNGVGIAGLHDTARLVPIRVSQACGLSPASIADGIVWAADAGAGVIVVPVSVAVSTTPLEDAVAYAASCDAVLIAAAGNTGDAEIRYPAGHADCLAVSSTTNQDELAETSTFGPHIELAAPGKDIWSTSGIDGYAFGDSTAFAAAHVAGVAALVRACAPQLSAIDVSQVLIASAEDLGVPGWDELYGHGRVNAEAALLTAPLPALRIVAVDPLPESVPPDVSTSIVVRIVEGTESVQPGTAMLGYRTSSPEFATAPLTDLGDGLYRADLPAAPCETTIEYYFTATGDLGTLVFDPLDAPVTVYTTLATEDQILRDDDFETDQGWETEADGGEPTTGQWERVDPVGTFAQPEGTPAQPEYDYSPNADTHCYVTGQHLGGSAGSADVDFGPVRLISPAVAVGTLDAEVRFASWFYSAGGEDPDVLTVELSRDDGQSWTEVEIIQPSAGWEVHTFNLSDFPGVVGSWLRVRFTTSDLTNDSLTEAAIDEFRVRAILCSGTPGGEDGDANNDGHVDLDDYAMLPACLSGPATPSPGGVCDSFDFDDDGYVDLSDVDQFMIVFGTDP